jgi:hypothetical protein
MTSVSNSSTSVSAARRGSHPCPSICCRLIDSDTNSSPVSAAAAPATPMKKSCQNSGE